MPRDRTARLRIREHLATYGPVEDRAGRATAALMEAVSYQGAPTGFIQLIAAMHADGEIVRTIKGKRTYAIALASPARATGSSASPNRDIAADPVDSEFGALDYDRLARSLLREVWHVLAASRTDAPVSAQPTIAQLMAECDRLSADRDEYARRLEVAQRRLANLIVTQSQNDEIAEQDRALLADLVSAQRSTVDAGRAI